jgi:hypothetical protein
MLVFDALTILAQATVKEAGHQPSPTADFPDGL